MLEVVFSRSAEGSMACAQHCKESVIGSAAAVIYKEEGKSSDEKEPAASVQEAVQAMQKRQKAARSLGGRREDIFCFSNELSSGDISGSCLSENRTASLQQYAAIAPEDAARLQADVTMAERELLRLLDRAGQGEIIRIWYSSQPYELCGLYWLISELNRRTDSLPAIHLICLPEFAERDGQLIRYLGWGGVCPEEFADFLPLEQEAGKAFIQMALTEWEELQRQNTPLRAVINGRIQSVPENFYDFLIGRELAEMPEEFSEAVLIGNVLGKYQPGVGDLWLALRIEQIIAEGRLIPVTVPAKGNAIYRRILRKITVG